MPPDDLVDFCAHHDLDVAVITLTNPACTEVAADAARRIEAAGTPTIVGGPGRTLDDLLDAARHATTAHRRAAPTSNSATTATTPYDRRSAQ